ncbi:MAG: hypothetical protein WCB73_14410, partial [Pseudonocardiaceae bacterium]
QPLPGQKARRTRQHTPSQTAHDQHPQTKPPVSSMINLGYVALELHPDKTRLIEFGRFAATNRQARGLGKPETFDFLGFTHICARMRDGRFWVRRITVSKRMRAKLREVKDQLKRRRHQPIPEQGRWLASVVRGYRAYYAVPGNRAAVATFRT